MNSLADMADTPHTAVADMAIAPASSFADWRRARLQRARRDDTLRWGLSFLAVLVLTGGVVGWVMHLPPPAKAAPAPPPAAIAIDMAPEPVSTPAPPTDAPLGPQQTLSQVTPQPDPPPQVMAPPSPAPN
ncbi:MAG: energy transducer TonB, partial [Acetobacter sp.]